jgi:NAD(P)H dehydrogenase (quinone)
MHSLIVTAHPSSTGFTHKIASVYAAKRQSTGNTAEILNLYTTPLRQSFLEFENEDLVSSKQKELTELQQKIQAADELVFVFPLWWYDVPAILKNFLDCNFSSGFAFEYTKQGIKGLFTNKTVRFFSTSGAPAFLYKYGILKHSPAFKASMKSCGMKITSQTFFGGRRGEDAAQEVEWLKQVEAVAAQ